MAFSSATLKQIVYDAVRTSLVNQLSSKMDTGLSASQKEEAQEQLRILARAVSEAVPHILTHIANNGEVTVREDYRKLNDSGDEHPNGYSWSTLNPVDQIGLRDSNAEPVIGRVIAKGTIR